MKPAPFDYAAPRSCVETLEILRQHGPDARIIAGGQTLGPMLNMRIATPSVLVDINGIEDWGQPRRRHEDSAMIHALVRQREALVRGSPFDRVPLLGMVMPFVGHYQTRNRGTICGSIAHGDPTAELPLALLVLGGVIHLTSAKRRREVPAASFYLGPLTTERQPDELIVATEWPTMPSDTRFAFHEVGLHGGHSTLCGAAAAMRTDRDGHVIDLRIGLNAISDRPSLLDTQPFIGAAPDEEWLGEIVEAVRTSFTFANDIHASSDYRRHVAGALVARCLKDLTTRHAEAT